MHIDSFQYSFAASGTTDVGMENRINDDRIVLDTDHGFFAVSDGMGGLRCGNAAASYVAESLPGLMNICLSECSAEEDTAEAAERLRFMVRLLSDKLYRSGNSEGRFDYGATLAGIWLYRECAVFVGLGDSRGYLLQKDGDRLIQVTQDMNMAGLMVRNGLMTIREAARSPARSRLTAFVGMEEPATPESDIREIRPGDMMLLCSDGLYGMVPEAEILEEMRAGNDPEEMCHRLIDRANRYGGQDNISAVIICIGEQTDAGHGNKHEDSRSLEA